MSNFCQTMDFSSNNHLEKSGSNKLNYINWNIYDTQKDNFRVEKRAELIQFINSVICPDARNYDYSSLSSHTDNVTATDTYLNSLDFLNHINYPDIGEVAEFLSKHKDIIEIVLTGCSLAHSGFNQNKSLTLEVFHDEEDGDEYLTLILRQNTYPDDFMDQIKKISNVYRSEIAGKSAYFLITTDFEKV